MTEKIEPVAWYDPTDPDETEAFMYPALRNIHIEHGSSVKRYKPLYALPEGYMIVPIEPTEEMWGGLARDIIHALDFNCKTPAKMVEFLTNCGVKIPEFFGDESELKNQDHVISKGTRAVLIYKAMLKAFQSDK